MSTEMVVNVSPRETRAALLENGIPMDAVRQQAGHASLEMTARHYHASEKTLQAAAHAPLSASHPARTRQARSWRLFWQGCRG
jgi:site-specific recombinase XerD